MGRRRVDREDTPRGLAASTGSHPARRPGRRATHEPGGPPPPPPQARATSFAGEPPGSPSWPHRRRAGEGLKGVRPRVSPPAATFRDMTGPEADTRHGSRGAPRLTAPTASLLQPAGLGPQQPALCSTHRPRCCPRSRPATRHHRPSHSCPCTSRHRTADRPAARPRPVRRPPSPPSPSANPAPTSSSHLRVARRQRRTPLGCRASPVGQPSPRTPCPRLRPVHPAAHRQPHPHLAGPQHRGAGARRRARAPLHRVLGTRRTHAVARLETPTALQRRSTPRRRPPVARCRAWGGSTGQASTAPTRSPATPVSPTSHPAAAVRTPVTNPEHLWPAGHG